jgi:hypothetical protein
LAQELKGCPPGAQQGANPVKDIDRCRGHAWRNVVCVARAEHRLPWSVETPGNTMQFLGTHMPSARAQGCWGVGKHHTDTQAIPQGCANLATSIVHCIFIQGLLGVARSHAPYGRFASSISCLC